MTFSIPDEELVAFESWVRHHLEVIEFRVIPDTKELYTNDKHFAKLVKAKKDLTLEIDRYINEHN